MGLSVRQTTKRAFHRLHLVAGPVEEVERYPALEVLLYLVVVVVGVVVRKMQPQPTGQA